MCLENAGKYSALGRKVGRVSPEGGKSNNSLTKRIESIACLLLCHMAKSKTRIGIPGFYRGEKWEMWRKPGKPEVVTLSLNEGKRSLCGSVLESFRNAQGHLWLFEPTVSSQRVLCLTGLNLLSVSTVFCQRSLSTEGWISGAAARVQGLAWGLARGVPSACSCRYRSSHAGLCITLAESWTESEICFSN